MTIHTFETKAIVSHEKFYKIQADLKSQDPSRWKALPNGMDYWGLSHQGIFINLHRVDKKDFHTFYVIYRISARRVIENDNFVGLFHTKNYDELEEKVDELLKEKSHLLPKLKNCKLSRLDFCINAKLENQKQVKAYIKTIKKANIPSGMELQKYYDKKSKRTKPTKDDFTVFCSEYIEISIYNKYREMKKQKVDVFPKNEIEKAKNIVRIEIRCMKGKISALKKKYNIKSISQFMSNAQKIGNELYRYYLTKICNEGGIYTLREALERIKLSEYKPSNIKLLQELIRDCNESRSAAETLRNYRDNYGKTKTKKIVEMLDDIDTNYVTIAKADAKLFDDMSLPAPLELYKEFVK